MLINNFDPVALSIFSFEIRWYSLSYIFGIIFGWLYCVRFLIKEEYIKNIFENFISSLIIGIIVGGRLGYVIFYNLSFYINNPLEIFKIWNGGMSFHGAVIGIIIASIYFSNKAKINKYILLDLISVSAPIGIFLGRISNYINSELYGKTTNFIFSVKFLKIDNLNRHPSQLYEAFFEGIVLLIILSFTYKKFKKQPGKSSSIFLMGYSFFRFFIEFIREPDEQLGYLALNLTMGQILSVAFLIFGVFLFFRKNESV